MTDSDIPEIPRFYVNVPKEIRADFLQDCHEEVRTPPEMVNAILVKHYRRQRQERMIADMKSSAQPQEGSSIPSFGPKPPRLDVGQEIKRTEDAK